MTNTLRHAWILAACCLVVSCGSDDSSTGGAGGGVGGSGVGGSGGTAGNTGSGGTAGSAADGGNSGAGGTAPTDAGTGGAGGSDLCKATSNPFDPAAIDCQLACDNFLLWCETSSPCASPYCNAPDDCPTACAVTKASMPYVNAQWGCAWENDVCDEMVGCLDGYCK